MDFSYASPLLITENVSYSIIRRELTENPGIINNGHERNTALHRAAACKRWDLVELLVDSGANVNARDDKKATPLHTLLDNLADSKNRRPTCPLRVLKKLISPGPEKENLNIRDFGHRTPFEYLLINNYIARMANENVDERLLDIGQDEIYIGSKNYAMVIRRVKIAILKHFATLENVRMFGMDMLYDVAVGTERPPKRARWDVVSFLIRLGADVERIRGKVPKEVAAAGPAALYKILTDQSSSRQLGKWEYLPEVWKEEHRQPLPLKVISALTWKKLFNQVYGFQVMPDDWKSSREGSMLLEMQFPKILAHYVVCLDDYLPKELLIAYPEPMEDLTSLSW